MVRASLPHGPTVPLACPQEAIPSRADGHQDERMQVIGARGTVGSASREEVLRALLVGTILIAGASLLAFAVFGMELLSAFSPSDPAGTAHLVAGALTWTFGLAAPAAFGMVGLARLGPALAELAAGRVRATPAVRLRAALPDDYAVAARVHLPDGSRVVPEIVIGPFGAAIIEELPRADAVVSRGPRSWDIRRADGQIHMIDHPLDRAARDAERVRIWFGGGDAGHVVKVYAAVVGTDPQIERTASCASITPDQVGPWLASLPVQRTFDVARRNQVIRMLRSAL